MAKNLIIYYSRVGENYWNGGVKNISKGNTEIVAEFIQKAVGGDLFQVETVKEYAADYYACIDDAKAELKRDARSLTFCFVRMTFIHTAIFPVLGSAEQRR